MNNKKSLKPVVDKAIWILCQICLLIQLDLYFLGFKDNTTHTIRKASQIDFTKGNILLKVSLTYLPPAQKHSNL